MYIYIHICIYVCIYKLSHECKNLPIRFFAYQKLSLQFSISKHYSSLVFQKRGEVQLTFSQEIKCTDEEVENYKYLEFIINAKFFRYITNT